MISQVTLGDCMDGMKQYPDKYFDLAVVDPPYGIGESKKMRENTISEKWKNPYKKKHSPKEWDTNPPNIKYFFELFRISKNQIIWGANHFLPKTSPCWIVWDKKNGDNDFADCELAWTSFKTSVRKFEWLWNGFQKQRPENRIHPTQKPVALYDWIYKNYLPNGGKVIDTHLGSGSNRIAADKAGNIDFYGWEIDKDYYEAQEKRWKEYKAQLTMF